jgi:putative hydrolases of HD superfamily
MQQPNIDRLVEFHKMLLQFQAIDRALYVPDKGDRHENDVEHSYNLAMAAWFLCQYFPTLDSNLVIRLALVHDLVEIHAGDTFPFHNEQEVATKQDREAAALQKIRTEWADFPDMATYMDQYEQRDTPEAKFVYALDKVMPMIVNMLQGGRIWKEHDITLNDLREVKGAKVALSPEIEPYYKELLTILENKPELFNKP